MQVSLQALKAFESAARHGSFKAAAHELSLTPTAISHHVQNLESRLNVSLFHRKVRKIELTEAGKKLALAATSGFRTIAMAIDEIKFSGNNILISTTTALASMRLIPAIEEYMRSHPGVLIDVSTGESFDNSPNTLPIRFGSTESVKTSDILKHEKFDAFGTPSYLDFSSKADRFKIISTRWKNRKLLPAPVHAWLEKNGIEQSKVEYVTYDQELIGIQEALLGKALVFCSTTLTAPLITAGIFHSFNSKPVDTEFCFYCPDKEKYDTRTHEAFLLWLEKLL